MNARLPIALFVVLVALGAAVYFANQSGSGDIGNAADGTATPTAALVLGSDKAVERLEIVDVNKRTAFHKEGDSWVLDDPAGKEPDQTRMSAAASQLARLRPVRALPPGGDIAAFGLASPQTEIKITQQGGDQKTLQIGNQDPTQAGYYARIAGQDPLYLLDSSFVTTLRGLASDPPAAKPTATPTIVGPVLVTPSPAASGTPAAATGTPSPPATAAPTTAP